MTAILQTIKNANFDNLTELSRYHWTSLFLYEALWFKLILV